MDSLNLEKYLTPKKKGPNSPESEQRELITKLINKPFNVVSGLTRHLSVQQMFMLYKESKGSPALWWTNYRNRYMQNNMFEEVKEKLEKFPQFRERSKRADYLAKLALRSIKLEEAYKTRPLNLSELARFAVKFATYERSWRDVTMKFKELQGSDYDNKELLEKQRQSELGYK